jgi:hypothetical protein
MNNQQLLEDLRRMYAGDYTKGACDACEACGQRVMCRFHSLLSLLFGGTQLSDEERAAGAPVSPSTRPDPKKATTSSESVLAPASAQTEDPT